MTLSRERRTRQYKAIQYYGTLEHWSVRWMCRALKVSHAGYYKWLHHEKTTEEQNNEQLCSLLKELDTKHAHRLGYRRMTGYINRACGSKYGEKRILRLMKKLGIHSVIRPKKAKYRPSTPQTIAENKLKRDFNANRPNEKWTTDVTEFKWYEGVTVHKIYLSAILDLYDRSVVSYVCSRRNDNRLVLDTYQAAIAKNPDAKPLFHSDRGFQYTSSVFQQRLIDAGMEQSMSRVGHCIDNGPTEGLWGIVKAEMYDLQKFESEESLLRAIDQFVAYYNQARYQARFGFKAPLEVRAAAQGQESPVQYPIAENRRIKAYKARYTV